MQTFRTIFLTLMAAWLALSTHAQSFTQVDTFPDPFTSIRELYYELDTLQMPTGYLIDASWVMADVTLYKGDVIPPDSMAVDFGDYQSLYISAFGMSMTEATKNSFLTFRHMNAGMFARDTARLHGIALAYDRLDPIAEADGLITIDTAAYRIYDVAGRPRSPYLSDTMVTLTIAGGRTDTLTQNFIFEQQDILGQLSNASNFYLDAGQGFIKHDFGKLFSLSFPSFDEYQLTLKLATTGGWKYAKVKLNLEQTQFKAEEETCDESVSFSGGKYCIKFSGKCGEKLFRPLIVVNGFDPTEEKDLRLSRLNREFDFKFDANHPYANQTLKKVLIDDYGYDIIFVTFDDGKASNITTGEWLVTAIKSINARKLADGVVEETPIIGVSMGGLVTKIGIAKMEAENYDHQLSKFFTFDTPLRGANIPIGLQHAVAHSYRIKVLGVLLRKFKCTIRENGQKLFNPAAREMLLVTADAEATYRHRPAPSTVIHTTTTAHHRSFQTYFDGLSINIPHYAISNGASSGDQRDVGSATSQIQPSGRILESISGPIPIRLKIKSNFLPQCFSVQGGGPRISRASVHMLINNLPNYDLMAGGTRGTHDRGETENCKGKWPKKEDGGQKYIADYISFIPTLSSLNLTLPGELPGSGTGSDYSYSGVEMLASRHNDVPYTVQNHAHVTVTPGIADFLVYNLIPFSDLSPTALDPNSSILTFPYNYGQSSAGTGGLLSTASYLHGVLDVTSSGAILVNNDDVISNTTITTNPPNDQSPFSLTLSAGSCDGPPADITLHSGAEFIVGHDHGGVRRTGTVTALEKTRVTIKSGGKLVVDRGSDFHLLSDGPDDSGGVVVESGGLLNAGETWDSGSGGKFIVDGGTLRIKSGGQLRASFSGQIIARNEGKIILEDGALVQLWGGNVNESDGTIWIQSKGELVIDGEYDFSGSGFWQFDEGNKIKGYGDLVIEGDGNEFRRMQVNHNATVTLKNGQDFKVDDAEVVYESNSGVSVISGSYYDLVNSDFTGPASNAIFTDASARSSVKGCRFLNNRKGITINPEDGYEYQNIRNSFFLNAQESGVYFSQFSSDAGGRTPLILGCTFTDCEKGITINSFPGVHVNGSTFTSEKERTFAIFAEYCPSLLLTDCSVTGYQNLLTWEDVEGAVQLDEVTAVFHGGNYNSNSTAIYDNWKSNLTFTNCVNVIGNCFGIAASSLPQGQTQLVLDGMFLSNNSIGIKGGSAIGTSTAVNTFQMPAESNCIEIAPIPRLIDMDASNLSDPSFVLNNNTWLDPQGGFLSGQPDPTQWFCFITGSSRYCSDLTIPTNSPQLTGCGTPSCTSPANCPDFCERFPEDQQCWGGTGGGGTGEDHEGFSVSPNPTKGNFQISNMHLEAIELQVLDARGALLKVVPLSGAFIEEIDLKELPNGIYGLQVLSTGQTQMQVERIVIQR